MFTDSARPQPPHQDLHPQYRPFEHGNPYDTPSETFSNFPRGHLRGSREAGLCKKFERPLQYAHPLQSTSSGPVRPPFGHSSVSGNDASEHMLRRKTPNGTLAAGYDGTPVEWTARPHATKHLLMPLANGGGHDPHKPVSVGGRDDYIPINRPAVLARAEEIQPQLWDQNTVSPRSRFGFGPVVDGDNTYAERRHDTFQSPGIDSVMNDCSPTQHVYHPTAHQQVPTILQPMWPPCIGPTASNDQAPYGPYWPNGTFVPYRPAAVRDPRYNVPFSKNLIERPISAQYGSLDSGDWSSISSSNAYKSYYEAERRYAMPRTISHSIDDLPSPGSHSLQNRGAAFDQVNYGARSPSQVPLAYRDKPPLIFNTLCSSSKSGNDQMISPSASARANSTMIQGKGVQTNNLQFKEKALVSAHRIYINLLTTLHQSRKGSQNKQQLPDLQHTRLNIYPKPPRQPVFDADDDGVVRSPDTPESQRHRGIGAFDLRTDSNNTVTKIDDASPIHYGTYPEHSGPLSSGLSTHHEEPRRFWQTEEQQSRIHQSHHHHRCSTSYLDGSPFINGSTGVQQQHSGSPFNEARDALELLGRLCQESGWKWTDGMLLGGCLAYGLGEYDKALQWYSHVLSCDRNNVEALSNMAATFLSLNQRKKAEDFWVQSVKLRPSYFEAVEHLVGLLCGDHRGKEAVKTIDVVEDALRNPPLLASTFDNELGSEGSRSPSTSISEFSHVITSDDEGIQETMYPGARPEAGPSGYAIPSCDNGRMLALVHAKGNMLYALGDNTGAAKAFEDAILIGAGQRHRGIGGLIKQILRVFADQRNGGHNEVTSEGANCEPILLLPDVALQTAHTVFPPRGQLPGLQEVPEGVAKKAAISTTSNSLLSLAKIYQDGMSSSGATAGGPKAASGVQDILALYYLSLSLQPSPSTANNVGILLASVQQSTPPKTGPKSNGSQTPGIPGVVPGSGIALALAYYNYGLNLDSRHAHLYTNLGSLLKDIGQLSAAIKMYEQAVACDEKFDIALANLANAVKDQGRISDAIGFYKRAVMSNPDFAEAVCGLANALNSVCNWKGRGGIVYSDSKQDRWHVDEQGMLLDARNPNSVGSGWIGRVVAIVEKQLDDGQSWGRGVLHSVDANHLLTQCRFADGWTDQEPQKAQSMMAALNDWAEQRWEGAKVVRLVERATKRLGWQMYRDQYINPTPCRPTRYVRPQLPAALAAPSAPTVLPFHTFTCPLTAKQIRKISQRNGLRISCSTLRAPWLPAKIFSPPAPPNAYLKVGYVSSDFNNHPLAHLMQSVFGFHDISRVKAFCYATTASDNSVHREQIQQEAPVFYDASSWSIDRLVNQIVDDGIHILINLNGYTRGARNEVFAARPAPIQMSFMGFAGTLGAEWCDYLLADTTAVPPRTLRPWRRNIDLIDQTVDGNNSDDQDDWIYGENIIFTRDTFFCCDHRQSAPDAQEVQLNWVEEQQRRWKMRRDLFPDIPDDTVILGNFNQLYKIEPTTFRTWLRILSRVPNSVLWLLRFPEPGESNLRQTAMLWAGSEVASRIIFTDVAPKNQHIARARVCDLFLDTPECNAHTTAADVLWSGTPLLTFPRYEYKMCSRMAASILKGALPRSPRGARAARDLIVGSDEEYEERAVELGSSLAYCSKNGPKGFGSGRLTELRKLLYESRWTSALFDTRRWVRDLEDAYEEAWRRWVAGEGGDIWL